jgi:hypothetical protein
MTKTLSARGGALSALALVLALSIPLAPAEAQRRDGPRGEGPELGAERVAPPRRAEREPQGGGLGADMRRRAQRYGEPDAQPIGMQRSDAAARRAEQVDRRSERRAEIVERAGEGRSERLEWQGRDGVAEQIGRSSEQRTKAIGQRGEIRSERIEDRSDRSAWRIGEAGGRDWRDSRRESDWRDGRRGNDWRDGRRENDWRDSHRYGDWRDGRREQRNWRRDDWRWNYRGWYGWDSRDFPRWDRRWRSNRAYDWAFYRSANRFHFRPGPYYPPYRWHRYSRVQIGVFLDSLFFQPRFFINDPWAYRLPPVYGPYRWVRYYDDVLLVDIFSGEVVDAIYDFFW